MNYRKKTMQDWNNLTEEQQTEVIMHIGNKLTKQEIWYWEGLVYNYRTLQDRINKANKKINEINKILDNQIDYKEDRDIVVAIEEVIKNEI